MYNHMISNNTVSFLSYYHNIIILLQYYSHIYIYNYMCFFVQAYSGVEDNCFNFGMQWIEATDPIAGHGLQFQCRHGGETVENTPLFKVAL